MSVTLVTGAPGWLGTQLLRSLVNGIPDIQEFKSPKQRQTIRCLVLKGVDVSPIKSISKDIEIIEGDLRDVESVENFCKGAEGGTLFHLAGVIHPTHGVKEFYEINLKGTQNLLEAASLNGIKRAIIMSSNSPIGVTKNPELVFNEISPYNPYMNYGKSKMLLEQVVHTYRERGKIETVIVRAPWFYGVNQPPRQTIFFTMIKDGKVPIVGNGKNKRSMSYIDNLCYGLLLCEKVEKAKGETYWISDKKPYMMNEIVNTIERLLEEEFNIKVAHKRFRLPNFVGEVATFMDGFIQSLGLYHQKIHVLSEMNKTIACSVEKARTELGYNPPIELKEGMRRSLRWCLKNGIKI